MREQERSETVSNIPETLLTERGSKRWSWKRVLQGARYGFIFGVGIAAASLGASSLLTDISSDILGITRVMAFQIGYFTSVGALIGGFKPTSEVAVNTWRNLSLPFKQRHSP